MARSWQNRLHPLLLGAKLLASMLACAMLLVFYQPFIPELIGLFASTKLASSCDMPCCKGKSANTACCCKSPTAKNSAIKVELLMPLAASPAISDEATPMEHCAKVKPSASNVTSTNLTPHSLKNVPRLATDSATALVEEKSAELPLVLTRLMAPCPCSSPLTLVNLYQQQIIAANVQAIKPPPVLSLDSLVPYNQPYYLTILFDQSKPRAPPSPLA